MIFHHRVNEPNDMFAVEVDFRTLNGEIVVSHDRTTQKEYISAKEYLSMCRSYVIIANVKESGLESELADMFISYNKEYYFLDSQIPDIVRISKERPELRHRFILRTSNYEDINDEFFLFIKPKFIWLDWHNFSDFDSRAYLSHINKSIKKVNKMGSTPIIVSPELYGDQYSSLLEDILPSLKGNYAVCTKKTHIWRNYVKPLQNNSEV